MPHPAPTPRRLVQIAVIGLVAATAGCGVGEPRSIDPAGVDGLEIPTPTPEPADFVRRVDNPWFPLPADGEWVYEAEDGPSVTVRVTGSDLIAGVSTTEVSTTVQRARRAVTSVDYYAQDRRGNVWSFGSDDWRAGVDGAQAGLVMPATPRVGDGFVEEYAAGLAEDRSEVLDVAATASGPAGSWTDLVEIAGTSALDPAASDLRYYAPGIGLVRTESATGVSSLASSTLG
ncbi:hypothetical protein [Nocardioides currus]|uniref:Uncharacterized protein n=1 Tax=Nocardioides currus TaxID=2133958 RepID=A0A2R7YZS8_9ACTN|nr:hypothetical protein [Nocardioides currus]PUA81841.1 hypothetical protein C7S10_07215 [Nocardioides currus]